MLVYPDGREIVFTPERATGVVALFLLLAAGVMRLRSRRSKEADVIQLPPRTRIEARDSAGIRLAA